MQTKQVIEEIKRRHNPELAKQPGMVYQIWYDGEVTLQKSGELLGMRSLHCIEPGFTFSQDTLLKYFNIKKNDMPNMDGSAYVSQEDAEFLRREIAINIAQQILSMVNVSVTLNRF